MVRHARLVVACLLGCCVALAACSRSSGVSRPVLMDPGTPHRPSADLFTAWTKVLAPDRGFLLRWVDRDGLTVDRLTYDFQRPVAPGVVRPDPKAQIARFDPATGRFVPSSEAEWESEPGEVWPGPRGGAWQVELPGGEMVDRTPGCSATLARWKTVRGADGKRVPWRDTFDGQEYRLPEPYLFARVPSPCCRYMAVLLQDGMIVGSMWGPSRSPNGYTYVVIYDAQTGAQISDVYRVGDTRLVYRCFWLADSRHFFVYFEGFEGQCGFVLPNPALSKTAPLVK